MKTFLLTLFSIFLVLQVSTVKGQNQSKRKSILIGIKDYRDSSLPKLNYPKEDVTRLLGVLEESKYSCEIMTDGRAKWDDIKEEIIRMSISTKSDQLDTFIFYFSGLGTRSEDDINQDEIVDGLEECLLPYDAQVGSPERYLRDDDLARWINGINAKHIIVILDCSYSGESKGDKGFGQYTATSVDGIEIAESERMQKGTVIFAASQPNEIVKDGVFTTKLLNALSELEEGGIFRNDEDKDNYIKINDVVRYFDKQNFQYRLGDVENINPPLIFPHLTEVYFQGTSDAMVKISSNNKKDVRAEFQIPDTRFLRRGEYAIEVKQNGYYTLNNNFRIEKGESKRELMFPLTKIKVIVKIQCPNEVALEGATLSILQEQNSADLYKQPIPKEGEYEDIENKLKAGESYLLTVIGRGVKHFQESFLYEGYDDIHRTVNLTPEDTLPEIRDLTLTTDLKQLTDALDLTLQEKLTVKIEASDAGVGMDESGVTITLRNEAKNIKLILDRKDVVDFRTQETKYTYKFEYQIPEESSYLGKWTIQIELKDKLGNQNPPGESSFTVFQTYFDIAKFYYIEKQYDKAIKVLERASPKGDVSLNDDSESLFALCYYQKKDFNEAFEHFKNISDKDNFLGRFLKDNEQRIQRNIIYSLWQSALRSRIKSPSDKEILNTISILAHHLGREDEAKIFQ